VDGRFVGLLPAPNTLCIGPMLMLELLEEAIVLAYRIGF